MAYIGKSIESGTFSVLDTSGNTYNGSNTTFNLGTQVGSTAQLLVSHDGVIQKPGTDYTLASGGSQITFTTAPASGASIFIVEISGAVGGTVTPSDNSVGITQLNVSDGSNGQALTTNGSGTLSFASVGLAGIDDQTSSNDDQITITDTAVVINEDSDDLDFRVESNGNANMLYVDGGEDRVGIGGVPTQATLHIQRSDTGALNDANSNELMLEDATCGMTIGSATDGEGHIHFSDSDDADVATVSYFHASNYMRFRSNASEALRFTGQQISTGGETAPNVSAGGICIDNNAEDGNAFEIKNSDVSHGFTALAEADTYLRIGKADGSLGGVNIDAFKENGIVAIKMSGNADGTPDTTKSTSGNAIIEMHGTVRSGTSSAATGTSNGNIFAVFNGATCRFIFDAEGDLHSDSSNTTFDAYEDAHLVRAFDLSHGRGVIDSKFDKFVAYNHEKLADLKLVGKNEDGTPNHFINVTGMQRLHNGAIWQQYEKHNQLLEAVYDLAKEAVGEEKANAILEKHEVKRLQ